MREAQPITTQNPSVGHYHFAAAFPSHREHIALQRQPFASAWLVAILHVEGFKTCAKNRPSRHKTRLSAFTALPLPSQVTAHTLTCSGSPVPVPGHVAIIHVPPCHCFPRSPHREHVALQRQPFASAWPCRHIAILHSIHLEGFTTCAKHGPSGHKTPVWAFTALPLPSQVTANTLPCSSSPLPAPGHVAILHL